MSQMDFNQAARMVALSTAAKPKIASEGISPAKRLFPALVLGAFFLALLMALVTGALVYKSISDSTAATNSARQGAGLVCNAIHANDERGAIAVGQGPEGRSLVIVETLDSGTFETRFYLYQGQIVQEYSLAGAAYSPETATTVTASSTFDFSYSHGLLTVTTDQGTAEVALRSAGGGNND
mgnify:CR=1 FL=1